MANATGWEQAWVVEYIVAVIFALCLLGFVTARLMRRYQAGRNGGGRLVAWKDVVLVALMASQATIGLALGAVALAAPPAGIEATGPIERWARELLAAYAVPVLVAMGALLMAALASVLIFEIRLARYFTKVGRLRAGARGEAAAIAAAELTAAAKVAAEQVVAAAALAAAALASSTTVTASEVASAATDNTEAVRENTEAVRENTEAKGGEG